MSRHGGWKSHPSVQFFLLPSSWVFGGGRCADVSARWVEITSIGAVFFTPKFLGLRGWTLCWCLGTVGGNHIHRCSFFYSQVPGSSGVDVVLMSRHGGWKSHPSVQFFTPKFLGLRGWTLCWCLGTVGGNHIHRCSFFYSEVPGSSGVDVVLMSRHGGWKSHPSPYRTPGQTLPFLDQFFSSLKEVFLVEFCHATIKLNI